MRPVDIAVAFDVALTDASQGTWAPADVRHHLGMPKATLSQSIARLADARVVRGRFVNRPVLAAMLPILPSLAPLRAGHDVKAVGISTGFAAPFFNGLFRSQVGLVWPATEGSDVGLPVTPLHPRIPAHLLESGDQVRHALLACLDAVRGGKAREVAYGIAALQEFCALPPSPGMTPQPVVTERMVNAVRGLLGEATTQERVS